MKNRITETDDSGPHLGADFDASKIQAPARANKGLREPSPGEAGAG
ncbi:MAG: hypothetical protein ABR874_18300 [Candidatus Sulfotelmatobacter sp.]